MLKIFVYLYILKPVDVAKKLHISTFLGWSSILYVVQLRLMSPKSKYDLSVSTLTVQAQMMGL